MVKRKESLRAMWRTTKVRFDEQGVTLVELLTTLVLSVVIITFSTSIIVNALHSYDRTVTETALRDEADIIMSTLTKEIFTLKESSIDQVQNTSTDTSYVSVIAVKADVAQPAYTIGFQDESILTKNGPITIQNDGVSLHSDSQKSSIIKDANGDYVIQLVLTHEEKNKSMTFENIIQSIHDTEEGTDRVE